MDLIYQICSEIQALQELQFFLRIAHRVIAAEEILSGPCFSMICLYRSASQNITETLTSISAVSKLYF